MPAALLTLIGKLYDAALDPGLWPKVLTDIAAYFDAAVVSQIEENHKIMAAQEIAASHTLGEESRQKYNNSRIFINPLRVPTLLTKKVGDTFSPSDLLGQAEFQATRFYANYVAPMGWGDSLVSMIAKSHEKMDLFIVTRLASKPMFSEAEREEVNILVPHVQRALQISRLLETKTREVMDLRAAVDEISTAIFFVDHEGYLVHMNGAARRLLAQGGLLHLELDQLRASNARDQKSFSDLLAAPPPSAKTELVLGSASGEDYILRAIPLSHETATARLDGRASLMIFVKRAEPDPASSIELIAERYKLTAREMNVLVAVVESGSVPDAAAILGLKQGTVRSHLKRVFAKTGLSSQLALAKLVASYV